MLYVAAVLVALPGPAHSILGERHILIRLFRRDFPELFGGADFTRRTLRFARHFTTVLALGISALLVQIAGLASAQALTSVIGWTLLIAGLLPLFILAANTCPGSFYSWQERCASRGPPPNIPIHRTSGKLRLPDAA